MGGHIESLKDDGAVRESKLLWVLGNYSRFIRPGMVRIKCDFSEDQSPENGLLVSAYKDPEKRRMVYVFTNLSPEEMRVRIGADKRAKTYTTDKRENLGLSFQSLNHVRVPGRSVVTVVN